jgi:hypothetical protein
MFFAKASARRLIVLTLFGAGILPSVLIDHSNASLATLRMLSSWGWNDFGNPYILFLLFVLAAFLIIRRKIFALNWVDYLIIVPVLMFAGFAILALVVVLFVVARLYS